MPKDKLAEKQRKEVPAVSITEALHCLLGACVLGDEQILDEWLKETSCG